MITGLQVYRPGTGWIIPLQDRITVTEGDVVGINISVPYKGPEKTFTLYGAIGARGFFGFDEVLHAESALPCPASPDNFVTVTGTVQIVINTRSGIDLVGISPGVNYDLMVKIKEEPAVSAEIDDIIDVVAAEGGGGVTDIFSMIGPMMGIMMMAMVMPMITSMSEEE